LVHIAGRTQYRLTAFRTDYETLTAVNVGVGGSFKGTSTGGDVTVTRDLTPHLSGSVSADYSVVDDLGNKFTLYQGNLSLNYLMTAKMQSYVQAGYSHRSSAFALAAASPLSGDYSEARITIGLRRQFN
jgi:hypothetical protein